MAIVPVAGLFLADFGSYELKRTLQFQPQFIFCTHSQLPILCIHCWQKIFKKILAQFNLMIWVSPFVYIDAENPNAIVSRGDLLIIFLKAVSRAVILDGCMARMMADWFWYLISPSFQVPLKQTMRAIADRLIVLMNGGCRVRLIFDLSISTIFRS